DAYISKLIPQEDSIRIAWILGSKDGAAVTQSLYASSSREVYITGLYKGSNCKLGTHVLPAPIHSTNTPCFLAKISNDCLNAIEQVPNPLAQISIYPNPASTQLTIANLPINSTVSISDITGKVLYTTQARHNI